MTITLPAGRVEEYLRRDNLDVIRAARPRVLPHVNELRDELISVVPPQVVKDRGTKAGLKVHPHQLRHTYAHEMLSNGTQESDLMTLAGWRSREMLRRYAASGASDRALVAARRFNPGDQL